MSTTYLPHKTLYITHQVFKVSLAKYMGLSLAFREVELSNYLHPHSLSSSFWKLVLSRYVDLGTNDHKVIANWDLGCLLCISTSLSA